MFDPMGWLRFRGVLLRNWAALVVAVVWLLPVAGPFTGPVNASIITTGDVDPGGAGTQSDPWEVGDYLMVGNSGNGTLVVEAGGMVSSVYGHVGNGDGSTGMATITGTSSQWNNSSELRVGWRGNGTLKVEAGGVVSNTNGHLGRNFSSTGTVRGQWRRLRVEQLRRPECRLC